MIMIHDIKGAIFDIDGTLLDSMMIWKDAGVRYLASLGVRARPDLTKQLNALSMPEGAAYMKREYALLLSPEEIIQGVNQVVEEFYLKEAPLKPGVKHFLDFLSEKGVKMIVSTALDLQIAQSVLQRTGILSYFSGIVTCEEAGAGKTKPNVFFLAKEKLGAPREATWVFEDSLYAVRTAKEAGFPVCAVYDEYSDADQEQIQGLADIYLESFPGAEAPFEKMQKNTGRETWR